MRKYLIAAATVLSLNSMTSVMAGTLEIPPAIQQIDVWCWIAVSEMVMKYHDVPNVNPAGNYQCGIVGALAFGTDAHACSNDCSICRVPAGSAANLVRAIKRYPSIAFEYTHTSGDGVTAKHVSHELGWQQIKDQIDDGNPIIAGISPSGVKSMSGVSEHVALIVGYESGDRLVVNDPYPFPPMNDPYLKAGATKLEIGRYEIDYDSFVSDLLWQESFETDTAAPIDGSGSGNASLPQYCCTRAGKLGPYPNPGILAGGVCYGTTNFGQQLLGQACY